MTKWKDEKQKKNKKMYDKKCQNHNELSVFVVFIKFMFFLLYFLCYEKNEFLIQIGKLMCCWVKFT